MQTFSDILDHVRNHILRDREAPYLWEDEVLVEYIAQAHDEFAEKTLCIRDSTSEATTITLEAGVDLYTLHPTVLSVLSARLADETNNLVRGNASAFDGYSPPPDTILWLESIIMGATAPGRPRAYTTDESVEDGSTPMLRVYPIPSAAEAGLEVNLRVTRLPLVQCSMETLDVTPEIPRQSRLALAHGAAAFAYSLQDSDGNDETKAAKQRAIFDQFIVDGKRAAYRKMFAPLAWGFGRGGFTHSR